MNSLNNAHFEATPLATIDRAAKVQHFVVSQPTRLTGGLG